MIRPPRSVYRTAPPIAHHLSLYPASKSTWTAARFNGQHISASIPRYSRLGLTGTVRDTVSELDKVVAKLGDLSAEGHEYVNIGPLLVSCAVLHTAFSMHLLRYSWLSSLRALSISVGALLLPPSSPAPGRTDCPFASSTGLTRRCRLPNMDALTRPRWTCSHESMDANNLSENQ